VRFFARRFQPFLDNINLPFVSFQPKEEQDMTKVSPMSRSLPTSDQLCHACGHEDSCPEKYIQGQD
jgi:hypothetical protein